MAGDVGRSRLSSAAGRLRIAVCSDQLSFELLSTVDCQLLTAPARTVDDQIDELYRLPLSEFTAARNALAKSVAGPDGAETAKRIRALPKPTLVPWAVNQLFWHARLVYQRLMKSGETLRAAQIAALKGGPQAKPGDVKRATEAHRTALAEAVRQAVRVAGSHGAKPDADELSRTLESLSLAPSPPDHPGRLSEPVRPAGFEALTGVSASVLGAGLGRLPVSKTAPAETGGAHTSRAAGKAKADVRTQADAKREREEEAQRALAEAAAKREREKEFAAQKRKAEAALSAAERDLERSKAAEAKAREALEAAERSREEAHSRLVAARKFLTSNF
jgi:hypothetical protein